MYKKILISTDGSALSNAAANAGVEFASQVQAEIVGLFIAAQYQYAVYGEIVPAVYPTENEYLASMQRSGQEHLQVIQDAAQAARLAFTGMTLFSDDPAQTIIDTAQQQHCDLIFMGSHGRSGWGQLLLGSVTTSVLARCDLPVLVHRMKKAPTN